MKLFLAITLLSLSLFPCTQAASMSPYDTLMEAFDKAEVATMEDVPRINQLANLHLKCISVNWEKENTINDVVLGRFAYSEQEKPGHGPLFPKVPKKEIITLSFPIAAEELFANDPKLEDQIYNWIALRKYNLPTVTKSKTGDLVSVSTSVGGIYKVTTTYRKKDQELFFKTLIVDSGSSATYKVGYCFLE